MSKKELAVKEAAPPAPVFEMDQSMLEALPRAESSDFDIPRLTLVQPTSKIDGSPGDVIDSGTGEVVLEAEQLMQFVPVWFFKDFAITEKESKKWRRNEPKTANNAHYSMFDNRFGNDHHDGVEVQRSERLNLFVIRHDSLGDELPRVHRMVIKPSSFKEAKKFLSEWDIQIRSSLVPYSFLWAVRPKEVKNEKGKFWIYEFKKVLDGKKQAQVTQAQFAKVSFWVKTLMANKDKVTNDSGPEEDEIAAATAKPAFQKGELNY